MDCFGDIRRGETCVEWFSLVLYSAVRLVFAYVTSCIGFVSGRRDARRYEVLEVLCGSVALRRDSLQSKAGVATFVIGLMSGT